VAEKELQGRKKRLKKTNAQSYFVDFFSRQSSQKVHYKNIFNQ